jgi:hypothetical protein
VEEKEYVACQMVTDLSRVGNMIRIISRWYQMAKWQWREWKINDKYEV